MHQLWTPWRMNYLNRNSPANSECVFCRKVRGGDDAKEHLLYRGGNVFVTLNLYPYNNGHLMIIPFQHTSDLTDLDALTVAELMQVTQMSIHVLREAFNPQGFNIGTNMGSAAGAGIADHIHQHIVPRWGGDTNFLSTIGETRTIPEWIDQTYERLLPLFEKQAADTK
jgi:ATP adenylyltransferase